MMLVSFPEYSCEIGRGALMVVMVGKCILHAIIMCFALIILIEQSEVPIMRTCCFRVTTLEGNVSIWT